MEYEAHFLPVVKRRCNFFGFSTSFSWCNETINTCHFLLENCLQLDTINCIWPKSVSCSHTTCTLSNCFSDTNDGPYWWQFVPKDGWWSESVGLIEGQRGYCGQIMTVILGSYSSTLPLISNVFAKKKHMVRTTKKKKLRNYRSKLFNKKLESLILNYQHFLC